MKAHSNESGRTYDSWEDLIAAEANGYVVVGINNAGHKRGPVPVVYGPYPTKAEADRARIRLRRQLQQDESVNPNNLSTWVRPLWKEKP